MKRFDFEYCAAPVSFQKFVEDYWEQKLLTVHRDDGKYYEGLFSSSDLEAYLHLVRFDPEPHSILLANFKNPPLPDKIYGSSRLPETHLVIKAFQDGDSIVLNRVQRYWLPLTELCRRWECTFRSLMSLSLYLTPANSQGFPTHFEGHEVCVMQLEGSKTWRIYQPEIVSPLISREVKRSQLGEPLEEVTLLPGDFLYLPRGCIHEGVSSGETSLHLSVLIRICSWLDLMKAALEGASRNQLMLRKSLPPGTLLQKDSHETVANQFHALAEEMRAWLDPEKGMKILGRQFLMEQQPLPDSRFPSELESLSLETSVERHEGTLCLVSHDDENAEITFCHNFVRAPLTALAALKFVSENETFRIGDLPDNLNDQSKVILVRRLIREGLLRVHQA